jgi:multiple sugar transport system substrate-binding protein
MAPTVELKGITWDHTRGYLPMVATAQRYWEQHGVKITWHKRSLQEFGNFPLQRLVDKYDLLIIDHPFVGYAENHTVLLPLDTCIPADYLQDQEVKSVGASFSSYRYGGHQWALATDAATPVASYRPDLLARHNLNLPETWEDLLEFAATGLVIVPSIPIDSLMNLYYIYASWNVPLFKNDLFVERDAGAWGLEQLWQLIHRCPLECLERNPSKRTTLWRQAIHMSTALSPTGTATTAERGMRGTVSNLRTSLDSAKVR